MVMKMKISVIMLKKLLATLIDMLVQFQSSHFFHEIYFNALPLIRVILGGNENL